jgi:hypothetical protein
MLSPPLYLSIPLLTAGLLFLAWGLSPAEVRDGLKRSPITRPIAAFFYFVEINLTSNRITRERRDRIHATIAALDRDSLYWLRQMTIGGRPYGMPDHLWQTLERTGLVDRDFVGPSGIRLEYRDIVEEWFESHPTR